MAAHHDVKETNRKRLWLVMVLTAGVAIIQGIAAWVSGSLALLADAGDMVSDALGLILALIAMRIAVKPGSQQQSFGMHRVEVLAAAVNGLLLLVIACVIAISAARRLVNPPMIDAPVVIVVGLIGLVVNTIGVFALREGAKHNINVKGAYLEVFGDAIGSVMVVISALVIWFTGFNLADVLASFVIVVLIVPRAVLLLRDVVEVLLEAAPRSIDLNQVRNHILEVPGVLDVHDVHVWTLTSGMAVMSAHVVITDAADSHQVLDELRDCLRDHFDVDHSTFQLETAEHAASESSTHHD